MSALRRTISKRGEGDRDRDERFTLVAADPPERAGGLEEDVGVKEEGEEGEDALILLECLPAPATADAQ